MQSLCLPGKQLDCFPRKQRENIIQLFHLFSHKNGKLFDSLYSAKTDKKFSVFRGNNQKTCCHQALGDNMFSDCFP